MSGSKIFNKTGLIEARHQIFCDESTACAFIKSNTIERYSCPKTKCH